jgi:tetratricopeptide (TPR) repeat protein
MGFFNEFLTSDQNGKPSQLEPVDSSLELKPQIDMGTEEKTEVETVEKDAGTNAPNDLLQEAIRLHDAGAAGNDKEAVVKAYELLKKLNRENPDDPVINAYYGSITVLMGRDAIDPIKQLKGAKKGLKILDNVISGAPDNIQARILRGNVSFRLPEMLFRRTATAVEDFKYLVERYEQDKTVFSAEFYVQLLKNLSLAYKNLGKAEESKAIQDKLSTLSEETPKSEMPLINEAEQKTESLPENVDEEPKSVNQTPISKEDPKPDIQTPNFKMGEKTPFVEQRPQMSTLERETLIKEGMQLYANIQNGNKNDRLKAFNFFSQAYKTNPEDRLIAAYYADCLSLIGLDSGDMSTMFPNVYKAMKIINNAVLNEPDNIQIRFLRAYHMFRLPEAFFHRTAVAKEDFDYLIQRYEQDNTVFSAKTYWQLLFDLTAVYRRLGMTEAAKATMEKLRSLEPDVISVIEEVGIIINDCEFSRLHPLQDFFPIS